MIPPPLHDWRIVEKGNGYVNGEGQVPNCQTSEFLLFLEMGLTVWRK